MKNFPCSRWVVLASLRIPLVEIVAKTDLYYRSRDGVYYGKDRVFETRAAAIEGAQKLLEKTRLKAQRAQALYEKRDATLSKERIKGARS